jgi:hypothetical protein
VRSRGEEYLEKMTDSRKARRSIVQVCFSWLNRLRKPLVCYEKTIESYFALVCLVCVVISVSGGNSCLGHPLPLSRV